MRVGVDQQLVSAAESKLEKAREVSDVRELLNEALKSASDAVGRGWTGNASRGERSLSVICHLISITYTEG